MRLQRSPFIFNYVEIVPDKQRNRSENIDISLSLLVQLFVHIAAYLVKDTMRQQLNQKSLRYHYHEADVTILEGVLARGDRRVAPVIYNAYKKGSLFDAWDEYFNNQRWMDAFAEEGVDIDFYNTRERSVDEILPWDFIDCGVTKKFLQREWERAQAGIVTPNCRQQW